VEKVGVQRLQGVQSGGCVPAHDPQHGVVSQLALFSDGPRPPSAKLGLDSFKLSVDVHDPDHTRHLRLSVKTPKFGAMADNLGMGEMSEVVAQNLRRLMDDHVELRTQSALARRSKVPQRTIGRIVNKEVTPSLDVLEDLAKPFDLQPWQLLVPNLDPKNPPVLRFASAAEEALYKRIVAAAAELVRKQL
jgi:hypothetical protein